MIEMTKFFPERSEQLLHTPGAFTWWYADLVDAQGCGCVLVWSFALPFLPGSRRGIEPAKRPGIHLAIYEEGRPTFYLLQEFNELDAEVDPVTGCGRIGDSHFSLSRNESGVALLAQLELKLPHTDERLSARFEAQGPSVEISQQEKVVAHSWAPQSTFASGSFQWSQGRHEGKIVGSAYLDANQSQSPLHAQGIKSWRWGRLTLPEGSVTYYDITGDNAAHESLIVTQSSDATETHQAPLHFSHEQSGSYGLRCPRSLEFELATSSYHLELQDLVDDGPFYQRFLLRGRQTKNGVTSHGQGIAEFVVPSRIDVPWQRPFVRMKTHRVHGTNSMWLPLFSGHRQGRLARLFQSWLPGATHV